MDDATQTTRRRPHCSSELIGILFPIQPVKILILIWWSNMAGKLTSLVFVHTINYWLFVKCMQCYWPWIMLESWLASWLMDEPKGYELSGLLLSSHVQGVSSLPEQWPAAQRRWSWSSHCCEFLIKGTLSVTILYVVEQFWINCMNQTNSTMYTFLLVLKYTWNSVTTVSEKDWQVSWLYLCYSS